MKATFDCIPCLIRQVIETTRVSAAEEHVRRQVINGALKHLQNVDLNLTPPELGKQIFDIIYRITGNKDPYHEIKLRLNTFFLEQYNNFKRLVYLNEDPVLLSAKLAVSGNILDFDSNEDLEQIQIIIEKTHKQQFTINHYPLFLNDLAHAKNVLYLADNAGEIVFDKLFIEVLKRFYPERGHKFTVVVRGAPIINDATLEDARLIELHKVATVIDNGDRAPATILNNVSEKMRRHYDQADLVISKGQGNFETLHEENKLVYFMLEVKCPVISNILHVPEGSIIFKRSL
jgi:uncharacterized protein with ATP-grasp and redox domains